MFLLPNLFHTLQGLGIDEGDALVVLVVVLVGPAAAPLHTLVVGFYHLLDLTLQAVLPDGIGGADAYLVAGILLQNADVDKLLVHSRDVLVVNYMFDSMFAKILHSSLFILHLFIVPLQQKTEEGGG